MTYDKYMLMCEQLGEEPNPAKIPPEVQDLPSDMQKAVIVFNKLGDRLAPDIGYLGKDYSPLQVHMDVMKVDNKEIFLETLLRLDSRVIEKSREAVSRKRKEMESQAKRGA